MMSEVGERPRFVTGGYGRHRSQWVNLLPYVDVGVSHLQIVFVLYMYAITGIRFGVGKNEIQHVTWLLLL